MVLPSPPVLKTTIIQLNKELDPEDNSNNYEILTNEYNNNNDSSDSNNSQTIPTSPAFEVTTSLPNKKKRRRSTANIDSEELAKRKNETKQLHSIIEKRRRIKINREFEALKYLIPACRTCNSTTPQSGSSTPNTRRTSTGGVSSSNNNGNKIDGMYKLTILKSSVEYIMYLHHVIQKQQELITNPNEESLKKLKDFDIDFAKIPLNVNQYRNIDKEFNFKDLLKDLEGKKKNTIIEEDASKVNKDNEEEDDDEEEDEFDSSSSRGSSALPQCVPPSVTSSINSTHRPLLPTPDFTPDMAPILNILNKYSTTQTGSNSNRKNSYPVSPQTSGLKSQNPSPFTVPIKSSLSTSSSPSINANKSYTAGNNNLKFALPDPAVNPSSQLYENIPRKRIHNTRIPEEDEEMVKEGPSKLSDQDASKTLLSLRKSSIDNLLN